MQSDETRRFEARIRELQEKSGKLERRVRDLEYNERCAEESIRERERIRVIVQKFAKPTLKPEQEKEDIEDTWTVEQKMQKRLYWLGLSEEEATQVVERVKALPGMGAMKYRWDEYAESASMKPLFGSLWRQATAETAKWMLENKPDHRAWWLFTKAPQRKLKTENRAGNNSAATSPKT